LSAIDVINTLIAIIVAILGWNVKTLFSRLEKHEKQISDNKDHFHDEIKELYLKHDNSTDKLRGEINNLADSIRKDINAANRSTNDLILKIVQK